MIDLSFGGTSFPRSLEVRDRLYSQGNQIGLTERFRRLDRLEAFARALEYAHHATDWFGRPADAYETISHQVSVPKGFTQPNNDVPVADRRPTAPMRLTPFVVNRFTGLLFGRGRVPEIFVEDDLASEDFVRTVWKKAKFWRTMRQARRYGGGMGSVLVLVTLRDGRYVFKAHNPKTVASISWLDEDARIPDGVLIQYPFFREVPTYDTKTGVPTGRTRRTTYLYRRIVDTEMDVVFHPVELQEGQPVPEMQIDLENSFAHRLGRLPGVWIQNLPNEDEIDGVSDCEGAYQMFDAMDRQVAQANRSLLANMDPTLVLSRDPKLEQRGVPIRKGSENALSVGTGGSATYLEMNGSAIAASKEFVAGLRQHALDLVQMVAPDPEKVSGAAQSAKAIEYLYAPTLEKADELREQYEDAIVELGEITLQLGRKFRDPASYAGNAVPRFAIPPRVEKETDPTTGLERVMLVPREPGDGSLVTLRWGRYFQPTPADIQAAVTTILSLVSAKIFDIETATKRIAPLFDIEDVENLLAKVREQQAAPPPEQQIPGMFPQPTFVPDEEGAGAEFGE